jgi:hypothetical protein
MIKYKFAYNSQNQTVDIQILSKENRNDNFKCLGCGNELVPVLGQKRVKHFRHKALIEINCSPETYLHKLAKTKFYEVYQDCLVNNKPFLIGIEINPVCNFYQKDFLKSCELSAITKEFDLTKYFKKISIECREGAFVPDVLLEADKEKIFFEVAVTHRSSPEKIASGYRIIEMIVKSEDDIERIESCSLQWFNEGVKFFNFKTKQAGDYCQGKCKNGIVPYSSTTLTHDVFLVQKTGECSVARLSAEKIESLKSNALYLEYLEKGRTDAGVYRNRVVEAYQKGVKIKDCFLCKHHTRVINPVHLQFKVTGVFCKIFKDYGIPSTAVNCKYFFVDYRFFKKYQEAFWDTDW